MICEVLSCKKYSDNIQELIISRNEIQFEPGNCIDIFNSESGIKKPYSIASSPLDNKTLRFYTRTFNSDTGVSQYITKLKAGDKIEVGEAFGYFTPGKNEENQKYIYIGTGTGMAPFMSALDFYDHKPKMVLCGVRKFADILPFNFNNIKVHIAVSQADVRTELPRHIISYYRLLPTDMPNDYNYYICGLEDMISECTQYLISKGVSWDKIHLEQFYYSNK